MIIPGNILLVFSAATLYVLHAVLVKSGAGKIDSFSSIFFWTMGAVTIGLISLGYSKYTGQDSFSWQSALLGSAAGASLAVGTLFFFLAYSRGTDISFAVPIVNISVVMGGIFFGYLFFKEDISALRVLGFVLGIFSIILLSRS